MRRSLLLIAVLITAPLRGAPIDEVEFRDTHKMIKPQPGEWKWAEVPWMLSVREARRKALELGRPLVIVLSAQGSIAGCL